jgi:predicted branched-subunit amino acid permease
MADRDKRKLIGRSAASGFIKAIAYHVTITYLLPIGAPVVTGAVGYLQGFPWMYVFVASALTFGGTATGLVRFDEWLFRRSVK